MISWPGKPVDVGDRGPGEELEVVHRLRVVGQQSATVLQAPGGYVVLAGPLVLGDDHVEGANQAGGRGEQRHPAAEVGERGMADRRDQRVIGLVREAVGLHRPVMAAAVLAEAGLAVRCEDVRLAVVRHRTDLRAGAARGAAAGRLGDDRIAGHALADDRQQLRVEDADLHRPTGQVRPPWCELPSGWIAKSRELAGPTGRGCCRRRAAARA